MTKLAILGGTPVRRKPLQPVWPDFGDEEARQLMEVLERTREGMGKPIGKTADFEKKFAKFHEAAGAVACTNCSQALEIMLAVAGVRPGDEVIVPPFTYVATAGAVVALGAIPVFADIDLGTYQIDPDSIAERISSRTTAIIPVHFAGHFSDMERICRIAEQHHLIVIEDAAQAHGAKWNGSFPGHYGLAAGFSFQYGKNMTSQEGGAIVSNDDTFIDKCWEYVWYGRKKGEPWYNHYQITSNFRMTEFQGAILLAQLAKLPVENQKREESAAKLDAYLASIDGVEPSRVDRRTEIHPRHLYPVRFEQEIIEKAGGKQRLVDAVSAEGLPLLFGYEFPVYRTPAFQRKHFRCDGWFDDVYRSVDYSHMNLPNAERLCRESAWFLHASLLCESQDIEDMAAAFDKVIRLCEDLKS